MNEDDSIPTAIYCTDNGTVFGRANTECSELPGFKANFEKQLQARETLKVAEDALVEYGLNIALARKCETLQKASKDNYTTKRKIIDLVMRLDVSTVPV